MGMTPPYTQKIQATVQPVATVGNSLLMIVGEAPFPGIVSEVTYTPTAAQAGANGNSRTLNLYNRGTGAGSTVMASLALVSGVNLTDNVEIAITRTPANCGVAQGDIIEWESLAVGTGIADPGGLVQIVFQRAF
jgi:hypothetical protein